MAQMEFCIFGILFLKSSCQINTQNKGQSSCRSMFVINDNAEWSLFGQNQCHGQHHPTDVSVALPLWRTHQSLHKTKLCWVWLRPLQNYQWETWHMSSKAAQIRASNQCSVSLQKLRELPHSQVTFWHLGYVCWLMEVVAMPSYLAFDPFRVWAQELCSLCSTQHSECRSF